MPTPASPSFNWKDFWDIAAHIGTLIGLAVAAVWAYFNFVKSRTYYPRMELEVSGELRTHETQRYLVPRVTLRNIGKSKVQLNQHGSGFRVWVANGATDEWGALAWSGGGHVFPIFEDHAWIEPGESIFDELTLLPLPANCIAAKVQVRLTAPIGWPRGNNTVWNCSTIIGPGSGKEGNENEQLWILT
jgi:hypothetical protein